VVHDTKNSLDAMADWQPPHLLGMHREKLVQFFSELPAPQEGEISGEYAGFDYLGHTREGWDAGWGRAEAGQGTWWLGKAIGKSEGYNRILNPDGSISRMMRYGVRLGDSLLDGRPALLLVYSDFNNPTGDAGLVDEVRKVNDNLFLAACTFPDESGGRTEPAMIVLAGPATAWIGVDDDKEEVRS